MKYNSKNNSGKRKRRTPETRWEKCLDAMQRFGLMMLSYWKLWLMIAAVICVAFLLRGFRDSRVAQALEKPVDLRVEQKKNIDVSPEEIRAVRNIGEFEFLRVETEELAELTETGVLRDKQIARIYSGTLRIGFNLSDVPDNWFEARGDTAVLNVPRLRLLDSNFIDETRTRPLYEKGTWRPEAYETLYKQARKKMIDRVLTPARFRSARQNATEKLSRIFLDLGFNNVIINYTY